MPILGYPYKPEGKNESGAGFVEAESNRKYVQKVTVPNRMRIAKLSALLDGQGYGESDFQELVGVIYGPDEVIRAASVPQRVKKGQQKGWVDLRFDNIPGGVALEPGQYWFGFVVGIGLTIRLHLTQDGGTWNSGPDVLGPVQTTTTEAITLPKTPVKVASASGGFDSQGALQIAGQTVLYTGISGSQLNGVSGGSGLVPSGSLVEQSGPAYYLKQQGFGGNQPGTIMMFATYFLPSLIPAIDDIQVGRYPFSLAQQVFGTDPPQAGTSRIATCSWHGTIINPERGSFAVVNRGGEFTDLIGDRVRVSTFDGRSVNAYVIGEAGLEDDISITRRLFLALGRLSMDSLNVRVEVLSNEARS